MPDGSTPNPSLWQGRGRGGGGGGGGGGMKVPAAMATTGWTPPVPKAGGLSIYYGRHHYISNSSGSFLRFILFFEFPPNTAPPRPPKSAPSWAAGVHMLRAHIGRTLIIAQLLAQPLA